MPLPLKHILIIADIEGSSLCWNYPASAFMDPQWPEACLGMTLDVNRVVTALFHAGVETVWIKDFHRTGFNIFPERIHPRARLISGYHRGQVPGLGDPGPCQAVMFLGMHAASGTNGFLAHTMTSRLRRVEVNGRPMAEVELFAASLAPFGIRPVFFSGCPVACCQASEAIPELVTWPIEKQGQQQDFDARLWRDSLAAAAVASLDGPLAEPYLPSGPFSVRITWRDGVRAARTVANRWGLQRKGDSVFFEAANMADLFMGLIRISYFTPLIEQTLAVGLPLFNARGRFGLAWARRQLISNGLYPNTPS